MRFFASPRASARNDRALLVNGVRRGRSSRLTPPQKLKVSFRMKRSEMRNLQGEYVGAFPLTKRKLSLVAKRSEAKKYSHEQSE